MRGSDLTLSNLITVSKKKIHKEIKQSPVEKNGKLQKCDMH